MIKYAGRRYKFATLASKIARKKRWSLERARAYVAGIEKRQNGK